MSEAKGKLVIKREGKEREEKSETFGMGGVGKTNFLLRLLFIKPKQESMLQKKCVILPTRPSHNLPKIQTLHFLPSFTTHNSQLTTTQCIFFWFLCYMRKTTPAKPTRPSFHSRGNNYIEESVTLTNNSHNCGRWIKDIIFR